MATNTPGEDIAKTLGDNEAPVSSSIPSVDSDDEKWVNDTSPRNSFNLRPPEEGIVFGNGSDDENSGEDVEVKDMKDKARDKSEELAEAVRTLKAAMELVEKLTKNDDSEEGKNGEEDEESSDGEEGEKIPDAGLPYFAIFVFWTLGMMGIAAIDAANFSTLLSIFYGVLFLAYVGLLLKEFSKFCCCNRKASAKRTCRRYCRNFATFLLLFTSLSCPIFWLWISRSRIIDSLRNNDTLILPSRNNDTLLFFILPKAIPVVILSVMWITAKIRQRFTTNPTTDNLRSFGRGYWESVWIYVTCQQFGSFVFQIFPEYHFGRFFPVDHFGSLIQGFMICILVNIMTTLVFYTRLANWSKTGGNRLTTNVDAEIEGDDHDARVVSDFNGETQSSGDANDPATTDTDANMNEDSHDGIYYLDLLVLLIVGILLGPIFFAAKVYPLYIILGCFSGLVLLFVLVKAAIAFSQESNRSANDQNGKSMPGEKLTYPSDSYSFLALYSPVHQTNLFCFGFMVFMFQFVLLVLLITSIIQTPSDNPENEKFAYFMPANASPYVRAAQFIAIFAFVMFKDSNVDDITIALELLFFKLDSNEKRRLALSSSLRLLQGILSVITVALLVVTSSDVIDIILNFTAINFISQLDNIAFEVADSGKFGPTMEMVASNMKGKELPDGVGSKSKHRRYLLGIGFISFALLVFILSIVTFQERNRIWVTQSLKVQFGDGYLERYSGCYNIQRTRTYDKRHTYKLLGTTDSTAELQYCSREQTWLFYDTTSLTREYYYYDSRYINDLIPDPCEAIGTEKEIAHSPATESYDISDSFDVTWFSRSNVPMTIHFLDFYIDDDDSCTSTNLDDFLLLTELSDLNKAGKGVVGTIPWDIYTLSNLESLDLSHNQLTGYIPYSINALTLLSSLDLSHNQLTSYIPVDYNGKIFLDLLTSLDLSNNQLTGALPYDIGLFSSLTSLNLSNNTLTGTLITQIGKLTNLEQLDLSGNNFTGTIPTEIRNMPNFGNFYF